MSTHYEQDAELETLRRWFNENWIALVAGLVIGVGGIVGWQQWRAHNTAHESQASQLYEQTMQAVISHKNDTARMLVAELIKDYSNTPYASDAQLLMAALAVGNGDYKQAQTDLEWVIKNGPDQGTKALAKIRSAKVLWQMGKPDQALAQIKSVPAPFESLAESVRGDILVSQGKRYEAAEAYRAALAGLPESSPRRFPLQMKLDNLAGATRTAEAKVAKPSTVAAPASSAKPPTGDHS